MIVVYIFLARVQVLYPREANEVTENVQTVPKNSGNFREKTRNCFGQISDRDRIFLSGPQDLEGGGLFRLCPFTCTGIRAKPDDYPWLST